MSENEKKAPLSEAELEDVSGGGWSDVKDWFKSHASKVNTEKSPLSGEKPDQGTPGGTTL